jgi:hypothetical protein
LGFGRKLVVGTSGVLPMTTFTSKNLGNEEEEKGKWDGKPTNTTLEDDDMMVSIEIPSLRG